MDVDGARNAKAEIFRHSFGYEEIAAGATEQSRPTFAPRMGAVAATRSESGPLRDSLRRPLLASAARRIIDISPPAGLEHSKSVPARGVTDALAIAIGLRRKRAAGMDCSLVLFGEHADLRHHPRVEHAIALAGGEAHFMATGESRLFPSLWNPPRHRPLRAGLSVAHMRARAGTLGGFVRRGEQLFLLSNNHVLADLNNGEVDDPIIQPARNDGGSDRDDVVGFLADYVRIETGTAHVNNVDCAIARLADGVQGLAILMCLADQQAPALKGVGDDNVFVDEEVWKAGRTSGLTQGRVFAVEVDNYVVNVGTSMQPVRARFDNQIQVYSEGRNFSMPGDSGSLVIDSEGLARGLLFAGTPAGGPGGVGLTAVNPIGPVLQELGAELWTG